MRYNADRVSLDYDDVYLVPNYSEVLSRKTVDTSAQVGNVIFDLPVIPSNMKTVVDMNTYEEYLHNGCIPIMHRFGPLSNLEIVQKSKSPWVAISIGVNGKDIEELAKIYDVCIKTPTCILVDVAHGHHLMMKSTLKAIYDILDTRKPVESPVIIAGNVTTPDGVKFLSDYGAHYAKVGIGPGSVCSTRLKTGFHVPMFTAVKNCAMEASDKEIGIIADGGIKHNGDIAKALVAGADLVMVGGLFASCINSPGDIDSEGKKVYYGSASEFNKGVYKNVEGFKKTLTPTKSIAETIKEMKEDLQSSISYAGGFDLSALKNTQYVIKY